MQTAFDVSLTGMLLLAPVFEVAELTDFRNVYLNAAAQHQLRLAEPTTGTLRQLFPDAQVSGLLAYCRAAYLQGEAAPLGPPYQGEQADTCFQARARRYGELLLVSLVDFADFGADASQQALRASQAREAAALAEARTQRQRLAELIDKAPTPIGLLRGPKHVVELANESFHQLVGYRPLVGRPYREAMPELVDQAFFGRLDQVYQLGKSYRGVEERVLVERTNPSRLEELYFTYSYQATRDASGEIDGVLVFAHEVTEQVHARQQVLALNRELAVVNKELTVSNEELRAANEEYLVANAALTHTQEQLHQLNQKLEARAQERTQQLQEQQVLLSQILGQLPAYVATFSGPELRFSFFNPSYQQLVIGRAELGRTLAEVQPEAAAQGFPELLRQVYVSGRPVVQQEAPVRLLQNNGEPGLGYYDLAFLPLLNSQAHPQGVLVFGVEVTEQVQARQQVQDLNEELAVINEELRATNEELQTSNTKLLRTNADLDTFVYTASHDLKAPITNVEGLLLALRETLPDAVQQEETTRQLLRLLDTTVTRFRLTITQLTDLVRLQQTLAGPAEVVTLRPLVDDVLLDLAREVEREQAQVHVEMPAQAWVLFAPASLRSIIYNLLSNALKYRHPERPAQVWVRAERRHNGLVLSVRDNGLGLTQSQQGRLFQVFQRLHTHVEGTGVGLHIIKRLIDNGGASISVTSQPQVGSTFAVTFST